MSENAQPGKAKKARRGGSSSQEQSPLIDESIRHLLALDLEQGFEELYKTYGAQILDFLRVLAKTSKCAEDIEDIFHEVCLNIYGAMKKYQNEEQWFLELRIGWLIRITKHAFLRWLRDNYPESRYKVQVTSIDRLVPQIVNVSSGNPGSLVVIRDCMEQLKEEQKVVIELCCIQGLSRLDAAIRLNKPVGTVKSLIHRGKEALKRCLEGKKVSR